VFDPDEMRVYWTATGTHLPNINYPYNEANTVVVLHLLQGVSEKSAFTLYRDNLTFLDAGNASHANFGPTGLCVVNGYLHYINSQGWVFKFDPAVYGDYQIVTATDPNTWSRTATRWKYESVSTNFCTDFVRKWVPWMLARFKKLTNLGVQIISVNNAGQNEDWLAPVYNTSTANASGYYEEMRRFPASSLRCSTKSIKMQNGHVETYRSGQFGVVDLTLVSPTSARATFFYGGHTFPGSLVGSTISFSNQPQYEYVIIAQALDNVTFTIPSDGTFNTAQKVSWWILNYPSTHKFRLLGYTIHYGLLSSSYDKYQPSEGGTKVG
jgi:hypothetical protein